MSDPRDMDAGPALPMNLEAELAILGALLNAPDMHRDARDRVAAADFSQPFHARLFDQVMAAAGEPAFDVSVIHGRMTSDPAYAGFGGFEGLIRLMDKAPSAKVVGELAHQIAEAALRRRVIDLGREAIERAQSGSVSGYEAVATARSAFEAVEQGSAPSDGFFVNAHEAGLALVDRIETECATGKPRGLKTGLSCFDKRLGGLLPGSVIVIGGRPGMGKTALLGNALYGAANLNPGHLFAGFSLEMDADQLNERALSRATADDEQPVSFSEIGRRALTAFDRQALHSAKHRLPKNLWLRDRAGVSVDDVARAVWAMKRRGNLGAIGIDYLQLMRRPALAGRNEASAIAEMTGALKTLAREAGITIILLSQLSRQVEQRDDKRPQLSDLRESGAIEQDADAILFPFREVYYLQKAEPKADPTGTSGPHFEWEMQVHELRTHMDVIIAKNRHGSEGTEAQTYRAEIDLIEDRRAA